MGKIVFKGREYGGAPTIVYVAEKALSDPDGVDITDYLKASAVPAGTHDITELDEQPNAGFHNSFYRGKDITSKITDGTFYSAIKAGTFTDLFVGDYFTINNHRYIIAGFNIYYNNGDTAFTNPHAVCIRDLNDPNLGDAWKNAQMNTTNSTAGGANGKWPAALTTEISTDFGTHLASFRELLSSEVKGDVLSGPNPGVSGASSSWSWQSIQVVGCTELECIGTTLTNSSGYDIGTGKVRLPLFKFDMSTFKNKIVWTRSVASATSFAAIENGISIMCPASERHYALGRFCVI